MSSQICETCMLISMGLSQGNCAAWVQAWGSIVAILAAVLISSNQARRSAMLRAIEAEEKAAMDRKLAMNAAAVLDVALSLAEASLVFAPTGMDRWPHGLTLEQARERMKLSPRTWDALHLATDKAHYFPEAACGMLIKLSLEAAAYDRLVDDLSRRVLRIQKHVISTTPDLVDVDVPEKEPSVDEFLGKMSPHNNKLAEDIRAVRELIKDSLPKT